MEQQEGRFPSTETDNTTRYTTDKRNPVCSNHTLICFALALIRSTALRLVKHSPNELHRVQWKLEGSSLGDGC